MPRNDTFLRLIGWGSLAAILIATIIGLMQQRGLGLDFANFYDAGQRALGGELENLYDPFSPINGAAPFGTMPFFSSPISSYLYVPMAALAPVPAVIAFKLFGAICILATLGLLYFRYRRMVDSGDRAAFFALFCAAAMFFQPFWTIYQVGGQTTPLIFLLFVLAMLAFERKLFWQTALLYVAIVLIKPVFVVGAGLLFLFAPLRFKIWSVGLGLGAMALSVAALGWPIHQEFLTFMKERSGEIVGVPYYNSHLLAWIEPLFLGQEGYEQSSGIRPALALVTRGLRLTILAWGGVLIWKLSQSDLPGSAKRNITFIFCMLASLIFSPAVWAHYLMLYFIPIAHILSRRSDFSRSVMVLVLLAILVAPFQNLLILNQFTKAMWPLNDAEILILTVVKSLVMLLLTVAIFCNPLQVARSYREKDWP